MQMPPITFLPSRRTAARFIQPVAPPVQYVETEQPLKVAVYCWRQAPGCFGVPAAEPVESLRDQARRTLADKLRDDFRACLNVVAARQGASPAERSTAFMRSMATAYLLGLPISKSVARNLSRVEEWTPEQVFGRSAGDLAALLKRLRVEALTELGVKHIPPGEVYDEVVLAAGDFWEYVDECIDNLGEMQRADGSCRRRLSPAMPAPVHRTVFTGHQDS